MDEMNPVETECRGVRIIGVQMQDIDDSLKDLGNVTDRIYNLFEEVLSPCEMPPDGVDEPPLSVPLGNSLHVINQFITTKN